MAVRERVGAKPSASTSGNVQAKGDLGRLFGFSARESAGATAVFKLFDGTDATGTLLADVTLAANESVRDWFGDRGIAVATGIYLQRTSGACNVTIFHV